MERIYSIEDVKNKIRSNLSDCTAKREAWEKVTVEKTKSGTEFKQLGRALKNAKFGTSYSGTEIKIEIYYYSPASGYGSDWLYIANDADAQTLRDKISDVITAYRENEASYNAQLAEVETIAEQYISKINEANAILASATNAKRKINKYEYPTTMTYALEELAKNTLGI